MLSLQRAPKRAKSIAKLAEAEEYFSQQWLIGTSFINKTVLNKKFGRQATNHALAKYFVNEARGSNVSRKLTEVRARDIDELPEERQARLLDSAVKQNIEVAISDVIADPPADFDSKSIICIRKENLNEAVQWCVDNRKIQLIKPVRILMSRLCWTVYYKKKTNRFFAIWPFCLTNWPSALRRIILSGVDFDLNNAIGQFIQESVGAKLAEFPEVVEYLENPNVKRTQLVEKIGINSTQAKKVLHATVNGASITNSSILNQKSSLLQIMTVDQALVFIDAFDDLIQQLKCVRKLIAPNAKGFMRAYFAWEEQKTGTFFNGTGLLMHDGIDGCSVSTVISSQASTEIKMSEARGVWDEDSVLEKLIVM
jgi:hypothetical protein